MIQPRIMVPPGDSGRNTTMRQVGFIEPGHWGGDFSSTGVSVPANGVAVSDWIILSGYRTFTLFVQRVNLPDHLGVGVDMYSRSTGASFGSRITILIDTSTGVAGGNWYTFGFGALVQPGLVMDIARLVFWKDNSPAAVMDLGPVSMLCGS